MANIPTPRSYPQILGDWLDTFLSRTGLTSIKPGSPVLSIAEASAQSDLRSSQDIFGLLNAKGLDRAEGTALERIGADEDLKKITESPSSGLITVSDTSFTKVSSKLYQGESAPIVGSDKLFVVDATDFSTTGSVYVGRGTTNYEGPLVYTAKTNLGTYWRLDLATSTTKFHNHSETVILAQGGSRTIAAGTLVQTPQGNVSEAVQYATLYAAVVPDGEVSVEGVTVIAQKPGLTGNVPAGTINSFVTNPFVGAAVTNPLPLTNAQATENDKSFRERIKNVRQSRAKGTALAIKTAVLGITAPDEDKRITSATVVRRQGYPTTLYIDDGTGYEERSTGIALETLTDSALGGEQYFQVSAGRPVTKAYVVTTLTSPFSLTSGMKLAVKVGGFSEKHTFNSTEFRSIGNASAYEVVASVNGDATISFSARTINNGTGVAVFAKADTNEDVEVVATDDDEVDANPFLGFSSGRVDTMRLYLNDRLMSKDGQAAIVTSEPQNTWAAMSGSMTLTLVVDGTPEVTYTFTDMDFVTGLTGYSTLAASNSLSAWATVFNAKIPGITCTATAGKLTILSNLSASSRASINISGGTLVSSGKMFAFNTAAGLESTGKARDYTLDRNTGQLRMESVLAVGDRLDLGSRNTRAFIESDELPTTTLVADGELWFVTDGGAAIVATSVVASTTVDIAKYDPTPDTTWGERIRITATSGAPFTNIQAGDWAIFLDTNLDAANQGAWRIAYVAAGDTYFEIEKSTLTAETGIVLSAGGIVFVRTDGQLQKVTVPTATNYTAATFADEINDQLKGGAAEVYRTNRLRVRTNTFDTSGDIALVAQNTEARKLGLTTGDAVSNLTSHLPSVQSQNREDGTPNFLPTTVASAASTTVFTATSATGIGANSIVKVLRSLPDSDSGVARSRFGNNTFKRTAIAGISGSTLTVRGAALNEWLPTDRFYAAAPFAISSVDDLTVLVDGDTASKRYAMNLYRKTTPVTATYGATNALTDTDNGDLSLALGFGTDFDFQDFAAFMRARVKSHAEAGDTTKTILWRYTRFGPDGNVAKVKYTYPTAANQAVAVSADPAASGTEGSVIVSVRLPSGAARSGYTIRNVSKIGVMAATSGSLQTLTYILGYSISSATRNVKLAYTGRGTTQFSGTVTGGTSGAVGTVVSDSLAGGVSGAGTLTLSTVTGTYSVAETLTGTAGSATSSGGQQGETTLTLNIATPGATNHGFLAADQIWIQSSSGSFSSGLKTLTSVTSSTVSYTESTSSVAATPNIGTVSFDSQGEAKLSGSTIVQHDIANFGTATDLPTGYKLALRVNVIGGQYISGPAETANTIGTVPSWQPVTDSSGIQFYVLNSGANTAASIATAVNALAAVSNSTCPVTAVAVGLAGVATGAIARASFDEFTTAAYSYSLTDGVNWIRSHTTPVTTATNFSFTFKNSISAGLATNSDWENEEVRLVPVTAKNAVDYMGTLAVSGLASAAEVSVSNEFGNLQIASLTPGSTGSIEVQGGTGNSISASVIGSASTLASTYSMVNCKRADTEGLAAGMWVDVQNANVMPKDAFTGSTSCTSIDALGNFVISGTQAWTYANTATGQINGFTWQIEAHGRYTAFRWNGVGSAPVLTGVAEGDWVVISQNATTIASRNTGTYRIVRSSETLKTFWIENVNASAEIVTADLWFLQYDSLMPGDTVAISTELWGADNTRSWIVESLDSSSVFGFKVSVDDGATTVFTGPVALGSQSSLVQCFEGTATKLVKQIRSISIDPTDGTLVNVKFETSNGYKKIGSVAGSLVMALDKLAFPTTLASGIDGYGHSTGLIGEAARILYGDERAPASYPGVVAAGANVNISGPLSKRITVALAIRTRSGVSTADVIDRVKSAVAAVINLAGVGEAVAISNIVTAAGAVNGVVSVTVLSPSYSAGNDLIAVQPFEKPLVLNLDQDVLVSLVGE